MKSFAISQQNGTSSIEARLDHCISRVFREVLKSEPNASAVNKSFLALGGDSLLAIRAMALLREEGFFVNVADVLQAGSIAELRRRIIEQESEGEGSETEEDAVSSDRYLENTTFQLTTLQKLYASSAGIQIDLLEVASYVSADTVRKGLVSLVTQHEMLRARLKEGRDGTWRQCVNETEDSLLFEVHRFISQEECNSRIQAMQISLDISNKPSCAALLFIATSGLHRLAIITHKVFVDAESRDIMGAELDAFFNLDKAILPEKGLFRGWAQGRTSGAEAHLLQNATHTLQNGTHPLQNGTRNHKGQFFEVSHSTLDPETTSELLQGRAHDALRTSPRDILNIALVNSFLSLDSSLAGPILLYNVQNGRSLVQPDTLSQAVGCFDVISQLHIEAPEEEDEINLVRRVKDISRASLASSNPDSQSNGIGLGKMPAPTALLIDFTYMNEHSKGGTGAREDTCDPSWILQLKNRPVVHITVALVNGALKTTIIHLRTPRHQVKLEKFTVAFERSLKGILVRLKGHRAMATLADFPLLQLSYAELDKLFHERLEQISTRPFDHIEDILPCSPIQEGFIISQAVDPSLYQCSILVKVTSDESNVSLDTNRFKESWKRVVSRHPSLRTIFIESVSRQGRFDQVILKDSKPWIQILKGDEVLSSPAFRARQPLPFDALDVHCRLFIAQSTPFEAYLKLEISHALIDGQSAEVLLRDLFSSYGGKDLPESSFLYRNYFDYHKKLITEPAFEYWSNYLSRANETYLLPIGGQPGSNTLKTAFLRIDLPEGLVDTFCNRHNITIADVLQLAWGLVLRCFSGSESVCFCYVASGRQIPVDGINAAVGAFISTLVCTIEFTKEALVENILQLMHGDYIRSLPHQHTFIAASHDGTVHKSPRKWSNTLMSVQRLLSMDGHERGGLGFAIEDRFNPTDVGCFPKSQHKSQVGRLTDHKV